MDQAYWNEGFVGMATQTQTGFPLVRSGKGAIRTVRKLERPRPLKLSLEAAANKQQTIDMGNLTRSSDDVLQDIEMVIKHLNNGNFDSSVATAIIQVCSMLKLQGTQLETKFKDQLDRYFVTMRNACREERLDMVCRLHLLEIIELRAMGWRANENLSNYYKRKFTEAEQSLDGTALAHNTAMNAITANIAPPTIPMGNISSSFFPTAVPNVVPIPTHSALSPGETLKSSGKFAKPTKIPGKNYFKDEIVIRNSDSGKVMGIKGRRVHMIEEFSDTVISFQRVSQGAKDRLVQITGPNEESISRAKQLIEETIQRNASPVRERPEKGLYGSDSCSSLNSSNSDDGVVNPSQTSHHHSISRNRGPLLHSLSMNDASIGEYQYTVTVGKDTLKISGAKLDLVRISKLVLEEYFAGDAERSQHDALNGGSEGYSQNVFITNSRRPLSDYDVIEEQENGIHHSTSSPNVRSVTECNGYVATARHRHNSSSSSGSEDEDETCKAGDGSCSYTEEYPDLPEDDAVENCATSPGMMTIVRQPLFPDSPKEAFHMAESSPNFQAFCAKVRRARFAKTTDLKEKSDSTSSSNAPPPSPLAVASSQAKQATHSQQTNEDNESNTTCISGQPRRTYSRSFLLDCAKSPYCRVTPKDHAHMMRETPYLLKKTPEVFDPVAYKKQDLVFHVFPVMRSNSYSAPDIDDDDVV